MFRISLIVCVSLILGITAKPWNKLTGEAFKEAILSKDDNGKMSWGVEVEPPEDMDEIQYDIDPRMRIWKSMVDSKQDQQPRLAEGDFDELYHPSIAELPQNLPEADIDEEILQGEADVKYSVAAKEDRDDFDYPVFSEVAQVEPEQDWDEDKAREVLGQYLAPLVAEDKADMGVRGVLPEPENDEDDLYHRDNHQHSPVQMEPLRHEMRSEVRVHLQPEEDMDDLYHKDPVKPVLYQGDFGAMAHVDQPSQKKYHEPEEDLDDLYHH